MKYLCAGTGDTAVNKNTKNLKALSPWKLSFSR